MCLRSRWGVRNFYWALGPALSPAAVLDLEPRSKPVQNIFAGLNTNLKLSVCTDPLTSQSRTKIHSTYVHSSEMRRRFQYIDIFLPLSFMLNNKPSPQFSKPDFRSRSLGPSVRSFLPVIDPSHLRSTLQAFFYLSLSSPSMVVLCGAERLRARETFPGGINHLKPVLLQAKGKWDA